MAGPGRDRPAATCGSRHPLLDIAGLAGHASRAAKVLVDGYAAGSLSMTAYTLDAACPPADVGGAGAAALPDDLDPEEINV